MIIQKKILVIIVFILMLYIHVSIKPQPKKRQVLKLVIYSKKIQYSLIWNPKFLFHLQMSQCQTRHQNKSQIELIYKWYRTISFLLKTLVVHYHIIYYKQIKIFFLFCPYPPMCFTVIFMSLLTYKDGYFTHY